MNNPESAKIINLVVPLLFLVFAYLLMVRPHNKREKAAKEMRDSLVVGDEVVTIGGFIGKVVKVKEDYVTIEIGADKVKLNIEKWGIGKRINS